ncbi:MAG: hypothetical protein P8188_19090, partial [Gemmatimonadota bacterium]
REGVGQPRWSPDGTLLGFLSRPEDGEELQVFVLPMAGGEARQVTRGEEGVVAFQWSADGDALFYRMRDAAEKPPEGEERHNRSFEVGDNSYLTRAAPRPIHLWRVALEGGEPERLTDGAESLEGIRVSPDGRTLALAVNPSAHTGAGILTRIRFLDLQTGATRALGVEPPVDLREFSPDGRWLAFGRPRGPEPGFHPDGIFLAATEGGEIRDVTAGIDRDLGGVEWLPDGRSMLVTGTDRTHNVMWHVPLDGAPERVTLGDVHVRLKEATADGRLVIVGAEPHRPPELYLTQAWPAGRSAGSRRSAGTAPTASARTGSSSIRRITWRGADTPLSWTSTAAPWAPPPRRGASYIRPWPPRDGWSSAPTTGAATPKARLSRAP